MNRESYLVSDEVVEYAFSLGNVLETNSVFGLHYADLVSDAEMVEFSAMSYSELSEEMLTNFSSEYVEQYRVLERSSSSMPEAVCSSREVVVVLKEVDFNLDEEGKRVRSFVRIEDDRANRFYEFLLTRGMDADDVLMVSFQELFVNEVLVMRLVMYWLEEPTANAYERYDERVYAFYVEPGSSVFVDLQESVYDWADKQREWYMQAIRG